MADYIVKDTELTSVANAIRTAGGTNSLLSFPNGFVSAVGNISGGGGGGDSDFSTATITIKAIQEESISLSVIQDALGPFPASVGFLEYTDSGEYFYTAPLYKGAAIFKYNGTGEVELSGNIEKVTPFAPIYIITGDCTITIS